MRQSSIARLSVGLIAAALLEVFAIPVWPQDFTVILANPERPQNERALDSVRKPEEVLKFYAVKPGDKVADLMAGRGYYSAILSRIVGDKGLVYSAVQNARKELIERFQNPLFSNVKLIEGKMDMVALPADGSLDLVFIHLNYHDLAPETRTAMNRRIITALKPGGSYGIVDHSAKDGSGNEVNNTLHRIDEAIVVKEITEAGFILVKEGEMLRRADDPRTESVLVDRGKSDRFVLRFERPK